MSGSFVSWIIIYFLNQMKVSGKVIFLLPRILCMLAILFISVFALDALDPELSLWQQIVGFLIHLIPSFILIAILVLAWKREFIGGIIFILLGLGFSPIIYSHNYKMNQSFGLSLLIISLITLPFVIVGILFLISHYQKKTHLS